MSLLKKAPGKPGVSSPKTESVELPAAAPAAVYPDARFARTDFEDSRLRSSRPLYRRF